MRLLRITLFGIIALVVLSGLSHAQTHWGCDDLTKSSVDTVRVISQAGVPGDTVAIPIRLQNDSIVTAFQFLIEYDTTWLRPLFIIDSTCAEADSLGNCIRWSIDSSFIDNLIHERFLKVDTSGDPFNPDVDTVTKFSANLFQGKEDIVACNFLPEFTDIDSLPGGDGGIFSILFEVDPTMPHLQKAYFVFHESNIFLVDTTVFPPETTWINGCNTSQMTSLWMDSNTFVVDTTVDPPETTYVPTTYQVYPTIDPGYPMYFLADTAWEPIPEPTITLTAYPTTVDPGGTSNLSWSAGDADSVILRDVTGGSVLLRIPSLSGTFPITLPTVEATYTFSATAKQNSGKSATDFAYVTVTGEEGDGPTIAFTPPDLSYRINQGETVSFTVTASETDGDQVTLTANALPNNASFAPTNPVIGIGTVAGTFSFTPDYNQEGTFAVSFTAVDKDGTTTRSVTIVVDVLEVDRLFSTSAPGQNPVGGLSGTGGIYFPINLITVKTVYGVQFDMLYPTSVITVDSFVTSGRIPEYVVYDNIGVVPGDIRVVTFGLSNEPVGSDTTSAILYAVLTLDSDAEPWTTHTVYIENGRESVDPDPNVGSLPLVTDSGIVEIDKRGDVNLDKIIDVGDAVNIVAYIIETYGLSLRQFATADVIVNDSVNVFDLVGVINLIYDIPVSPYPAPTSPEDTVDIILVYGDIPGGSSDILTIASEGIPELLAGVQLEIGYDPAAVNLGPPSLTRDNEKFALGYKDNGNGRMKVVLYHVEVFRTDELIQAGTADLLNIPVNALTDIEAGDKSKIRLTDALLSTPMAASVNVSGIDRTDGPMLPVTFTLSQNYPNPFNPETTIPFSLSQRAHVKLTVYNVLGQHVKKLIDEEMDANLQYEITWNAADDFGRRVASGVYLYRLKIEDESQTKKMLLLK